MSQGDRQADRPGAAPSTDQNGAKTARRAFVTGAAGFVGSAVVEELVASGWVVRAMVHRTPVDARGGRVESVHADLHDTASMRAGMAGCDAVIHLVGIIAEAPGRGATFEKVHHQGTVAVVDAAREAGVARYIHMSALGTRENARAEYHRSKWRAECYVRAHAPAWTIFRPSIIHGPGGEFTAMLAGWARGTAAPWLFMPYFGRGVLGWSGAGRLQPVHVDDVAGAFVGAIDREEAVGQTYALAGPDVMTWAQMHRIASSAIRGRPKPAVAIPMWYAKTLAAVTPPALLPFNRDQVIMADEDNTGDISAARRDLGFSPRPFEASIRSYAGQIGE